MQGTFLSKITLGRDFQNYQGGSCHLVKILLQLIVFIYDCRYDLLHWKSVLYFPLLRIYRCVGFKWQVWEGFTQSRSLAGTLLRSLPNWDML